MTPLARRRLQLRMRKAFKMTVKARKAHRKAVSNYRKLQKRYKAA